MVHTMLHIPVPFTFSCGGKGGAQDMNGDSVI